MDEHNAPPDQADDPVEAVANAIEPSRLYRMKEAVSVLTISRPALYALIATGALPALNVGLGSVRRLPRIPGAALIAFLKARRVRPEPLPNPREIRPPVEAAPGREARGKHSRRRA